MRRDIPAAALTLGLAGLIPFLWAALTAQNATLWSWSQLMLGPSFTGLGLVNGYGLIIFCFMAGVLWGFAVQGRASHFVLSILPVLYVFAATALSTRLFPFALALGFVGLLGVDWLFARARLAPEWWMALRLRLSAGVILCLIIAGRGHG